MLIEELTPLSEEMLMEDRIDTLKQLYPNLDTSHDNTAIHHSASDIIDHFATNADPTNNKVHTQYLLGLYKKKAIKQEDAPRIKDVLTNFDRYKQFLPADKKQLNPKNYPNISDIHSAIEPHIGKATTNKEAREQLRNNPLDIEGHKQVYSDGKISVYNTSDEATSQRMYASATASKPGAFPTEWCTAWMKPRECQLNRYRTVHGGDVLTVHHHPDKTVYQYHTNTSQFMNSDNEYINQDEWNKIQPSIHKMWDENPSLLDDGKNKKPEHLAFLAKYGKANHIDSVLDRLSTLKYVNPTDILKIHRGVANNKFSTEETYKKILNHPNFEPILLVSNRVKNKKFLSFMSNNSDPKIRAMVAKNHNLPTEDLERLGNERGHDYAENIRQSAISNPNASQSHINRAIYDESPLVRATAIEMHGHKLGDGVLDNVLRNEKSDNVVIRGLAMHPVLIKTETLEHLSNNHPSENVRQFAEKAYTAKQLRKRFIQGNSES
jgi:hypothetical protein